MSFSSRIYIDINVKILEFPTQDNFFIHFSYLRIISKAINLFITHCNSRDMLIAIDPTGIIDTNFFYVYKVKSLT